MDTDNENDIELLAYIPIQAKSLLHSQEQAAGGNGVHVNADTTEKICFNEKEDVSILNGGPLKLADKFTYLGSSVLSCKKDIIGNTSEGMDYYW